MSFITKPMLAADVKSPEKLDFSEGFLATPKIDGIRCLVLNDCKYGRVVSRTFKPIPNRYISTQLGSYLPRGVDIDGELIVPGTFQDTTSAVMTQSFERIEFTYCVFDVIVGLHDLRSTYSSRIGLLKSLKDLRLPFRLRILCPTRINTLAQFLKYEQTILHAGGEGVMLRRPNSVYKCGRSTLREAHLLKVKRWEEGQGEIIGFEEKLANDNVSKQNHIGYRKKGHAKAGKYGCGVLGSFIVRDRVTGGEFCVGSGLNDAQRVAFWTTRTSLIGRIVRYKHFPVGVKNAPRTPIFLGIL